MLTAGKCPIIIYKTRIQLQIESKQNPGSLNSKLDHLKEDLAIQLASNLTAIWFQKWILEKVCINLRRIGEINVHSNVQAAIFKNTALFYLSDTFSETFHVPPQKEDFKC